MLSAAEMASAELGFTDTVNAKIGLLYLHDYLYGLTTGRWCFAIVGRPDSCAPAPSWILAATWTITKASNSSANYISQVGPINSSLTDSFTKQSVRPVFYLTSSQIIVGGTGTATDPYMLS